MSGLAVGAWTLRISGASLLACLLLHELEHIYLPGSRYRDTKIRIRIAYLMESDVHRRDVPLCLMFADRSTNEDSGKQDRGAPSRTEIRSSSATVRLRPGNIGSREIVSLEEEPLTLSFGQGVGEAVPKVQASRMSPLPYVRKASRATRACSIVTASSQCRARQTPVIVKQSGLILRRFWTQSG